MSGDLGKQVEKLVTEFNESQTEYKVVSSYRGEYEEAMVSTIAAFRAKKQPIISQIYEVGTGTMIAAKGAVYPIYKLMEDTQTPFDSSSFVSAVSAYYSDTNGKMLAMPFNASSPILYYNKDVLKKTGLDPEKAPKT